MRESEWIQSGSHSVEQKKMLRQNRRSGPELCVTYFLYHVSLLGVATGRDSRVVVVMADDMNGSASSAKHAALLMLLDSDSSESEGLSSDTSDYSDSDSDAETAAYEREFDRMFRIPAKRPKIVGFIEDVVRQCSDDEFRRHFRLARPVAEKLIAEFAASSMCPSSTHGGVPAKSAETHILSFIWYAANKTCMRNVASRFDLSESSVHRILHRVADFLLTLGPSLIKFPADLENLTRSFEKERELQMLSGAAPSKWKWYKELSAILCHRPMVEAHHYGLDSDAASIADDDNTGQSDDERRSHFDSLDSPGGSQTSEMSSSATTGSTMPPAKRARNSTLALPELLEQQHQRTAALLQEQNAVLFQQQKELLQQENEIFKEVMAGITASFLQGTQAMMAQLMRQPVPAFAQPTAPFGQMPFSFGQPLQQEGLYVFSAQQPQGQGSSPSNAANKQ
ncbi:hypothetical protein HPB49_003660 [Dermacentor silvarum]|uniref:Uncharacterized protein n=1 Tax=Dermacentor silvarum TaxID=543639 RepID=A0ACB8CPI7_DERSI|nr:hypothetical protein HPB49_003660 [Dermacentor silvarum]